MKRFSLVLGLVLAACVGQPGGPSDTPPDTEPVEGDAFLQIVGESNVSLPGNTSQTLTVKYVNGANVPLAGRVNFSLAGEHGSSAISRESGVTNSVGEVYLEVFGGGEELTFEVVAEDAQGYSNSVRWTITVTAAEAPTTDLDPVGTYDISSQFDVVSGIPGTVGDVVNTFLDMTDGPNDPATWILDKVAENLDEGTALDLLEGARPALDGILNTLILEGASALGFDWIPTLKEVGEQLGQVARKLGFSGVLIITKGSEADIPFLASHQVDHVVYVIDGIKYDYSLIDSVGVDMMVADNIPMTVSNLKATIGDHSLTLSWGTLLIFALNEIIIPAIDPFSSSIKDLFTSYSSPLYIDCPTIGMDIADYVGFGTPGIYEAACDMGVDLLATALEDAISSIGGTGAGLNIHGEAKPIDTNDDGKVDKLFTGLWEGTLSFAGITEASVLEKPNQKFTATRQGSGVGKPE